MMKKETILLAAAALLAAACSSTPSTDGYTLTGHIEGLPDSTHVQLIPVSHYNEKPLADTVIVNGEFTFTGKMDEPRAVLLLVKDAYGSRRLMLENTAIEVSGTVTATDNNGTPSYDLDHLSVSGSPLSTRYDSLMSVREQMDALFKAKATLYKDSTMEARAAADHKLFATVDSTFHAAVLSQKDSYWGPLLMISLTSYLDKGQQAWYDELSDAAKASYYGQKVKEELYPAGEVGSAVAEFTVKDNDGKEVTLASLREGKKYVLIDFWASWCNPCRKEIPNLKNLYKLYGDKGFQIVSISIDKKKAEWEKALEEEQLPWPNFLDETGVADLYKVRFVPTMYLIDAQGTLVGENLRGQALADKLKELFQ